MKTKLLKLFSLRATLLVLLTIGAVNAAWADTETITLWTEDFSSFAADAVPSGGDYSYTVDNGGGTTKIYAESTAGGTSPELLVAKNNGTFTATISDLKGCTSKLTLSYKKNNNNLTITAESNTSTGIGTATATVSSATSSSGTYTHEISLPTNATDVIITFTSATKNVRLDDIVLTGEKEVASNAVATTITINTSGITNTDVYTSTTAGSLSATVTAGGNAVAGATVTWSGNNDDVAIINASTGAVTLKAAGSVTFTASYAGEEDVYQASSATYEMTVTNSAPSITVDNTEVNVLAADEEGTIGISYSNLAISNMTDFDIQFCDAEGNNSSQPSWIEVEVAEDNGDYVVSYILDQNPSSEARSAYFKVYALGDADYVYSDLITITQAGFVIDYATLPFSFTSGKSAIESTVGLTQNGLGSDYADTNAPLKFDGAGDYLILKINDRPDKLTFKIKNNSFSGGTFKVQTSEDGVTYSDLKTYNSITGTQSEEFDEIGADVRYIKWIYTKKSSGNVGLGSIGLTKYAASAPTWNALPTPSVYVNKQYSLVLSDYVTGTPAPEISLTTSVSGYTYNDGTLNFTPTEAGTYVFNFTATNSEGSSNATLTVTAETAPTYTLASSVTCGKHYIIVNQAASKAMGAQNSNNRAAVGVTINDEIVTFEPEAGVAEFVIMGPYTNDKDDPSDYTYTIYDTTQDKGYLYAAGGNSTNNYLRTDTDKHYWTISIDNEGVATIKDTSSSAKRDWLRYNNGLFSCYGSGQNDVYLYEKVGEATRTESVTVTEAGYATFASDYALDFTGTGIEAYIAKADGTTGVTFTQVNKVPAETGVLLHKEGGATVDVTALTGAADNVKDNVFNRGIDGPIESVVLSNEHYYHNYILNNGNRGLGFYKAADQTVAKNKAYITIQNDESTSVKGFIALPGFGDETAVSAVKAAAENGVIFNLAGQRVNKAQKGIFIVNGKKVVK